MQKDELSVSFSRKYPFCIGTPIAKVRILQMEAIPKLPYALASTQSKIRLFKNRCSSFTTGVIQARPLVHQSGVQVTVFTVDKG